jgi:hypothetical protein
VKLLLVLLMGRGILATARVFERVTAAGAKRGRDTEKASSICSSGGYIDCNMVIEGQFDTSPMPRMLKVIVLTLLYYQGLWDLRHALEESSRKAAAAAGRDPTKTQPATATAAGGDSVTTTTPAAAGVGENIATTTPAAPAAAGGGGGVAGTEVLPKRLLQLPLTGLPAAVTAQLDQVKSKWPRDVLRDFQLPAAPAAQEDLLQDLLLVVEVLLEEVPLPVGCSNTACVKLKGLSENLAASKGCVGCKVVRYCGRECQVAHWKSHKGLCKRLQEEQEEQEG